jgi:plasmid maintenance system antidote protein VapI
MQFLKPLKEETLSLQNQFDLWKQNNGSQFLERFRNRMP